MCVTLACEGRVAMAEASRHGTNWPVVGGPCIELVFLLLASRRVLLRYSTSNDSTCSAGQYLPGATSSSSSRVVLKLSFTVAWRSDITCSAADASSL